MWALALTDVQKPLRHVRPDTILGNYVKDIQESVYAMSDRMYEMISPSVTAGLLAQLLLKGSVQ
jgi:hypothetical protein